MRQWPPGAKPSSFQDDFSDNWIVLGVGVERDHGVVLLRVNREYAHTGDPKFDPQKCTLVGFGNEVIAYGKDGISGTIFSSAKPDNQVDEVIYPEKYVVDGKIHFLIKAFQKGHGGTQLECRGEIQ